MDKLFTFIFCFAFLSSAGAAAPAQIETTIVGVGATLEKMPGGELRVNALINGAPAERAGLHIGDLVTGIRSSDDSPVIDVRGMSLPDAIALIRGPVGEPVTLRLQRGASSIDLRIVREAFEVEDLVWRMRENGWPRKV